MQIQTYTKIDDFLAASDSFLAADEAANSLILGVAMHAQQDPSRLPKKPYWATVTGPLTDTKNRVGGGYIEREILLVAMMTPPYGVTFSQPREREGSETDAAAVDLVAQNLWENGWQVPDVRGAWPLAKRFTEKWSQLSGQPNRHTMHQRIYKLSTVLVKPAKAGRLRQATEQDTALVAQWLYEFCLEAMQEDEPERALQSAERIVSNGAGYLWVDENETPVSFAMWSRPTHKGIAVSAVYTPPESRGRGYASACVAALSQSLLDCGWQFCTLVTDLANPTSNKIYQRIGYKPLSDFHLYTFGD